MKQYLLSIYFLLSFVSCVEEFDLELERTKPRLVVEGLIENGAGPFYIKLTRSNVGTNVFDKNDYLDNTKFEKGAMIVLSDDSGQTEVLEEVGKIDLEGFHYDSSIRKYVKYIYNDLNELIDTITLDLSPSYINGGFYKTTNFLGIPGRTYFLKVITKEGEEFSASDYMASIPEIEKIAFKEKISEKDGEKYYVPLIYFHDKQEGTLNYYLFQLTNEEVSRTRSAYEFWEFSILSDKYLESYVNGLEIDDGASIRPFSSFVWLSRYNKFYLKMSSLSSQSHQFYKDVLSQFEQDGGAYKPTPASPLSNITNGGLGFFRASASEELEVIIGDYIELN